jgi:Uma2 family endonuclease
MSAMGTTTTLLSFAEFEQLPTEPGKLELLDGELIRMPPAKRDHVETTDRIATLLRPIVETAGLSAGLGKLHIEAGYKMGSGVWLQPDLSVLHINQPGAEYFEGAPALAVEVISESNTAEEMDRKVKTYLVNGGIEVWVVYPRTRCVWLFREGHAEEFRRLLRSALIDGLEIDLDRVFSR